MKKWTLIAALAAYLFGMILAADAVSGESPQPSVAPVMLGAEPVTDIEITITIPAASRVRAVAAFEAIYPIPQIPDPEWVDPEDGSTAPMVPEYTSEQWLEVRLRQWLRDTIARVEQSQARRKIKFTPDPKVVPKAAREISPVREPIR